MTKKEDGKMLREFRAKNGYEIEDMWLPRVTSILQIVAKPGLLRYYAQQKNFTAAQEAMRMAAENGIKVHEAVENFLQGKDGFEAKLKPIMQELVKWKNKHEIEVIDIERKIIDKEEHFYCGTADVLARIDGEVGILDIKTGSGIWEEYGLQTAAYAHAHNKGAPKSEKATASWILRLDKYEVCDICGAKRRDKEGHIKVTGGKYYCQHDFNAPMAEIEFKKMKGMDESYKAFLSAKNLWEWANRKMLEQIKNYPKKFNN
jgi:hypothetical protein